MEVTRQELDNLKIMPNKVLVKINSDEDNSIGYNSIKYIKSDEGKIKLKIDHTYNPNWFVSVFGTVENVCDRLTFDDRERAVDGKLRGMPWDTNIEIQKGDVVFFEFGALKKALELENVIPDSLHLTCEDDIYIFIRYQDIFCVKQEDSIKPVNGYVMGVRLETKKQIGNIQLPDNFHDKELETHMKVLYEGTANRAYRGFTQRAIRERNMDIPAHYDFDDVKLVGNNIIANTVGSMFPVENDINPVLEPGLLAIQRRYIRCVYNPNNSLS